MLYEADARLIYFNGCAIKQPYFLFQIPVQHLRRRQRQRYLLQHSTGCLLAEFAVSWEDISRHHLHFPLKKKKNLNRLLIRRERTVQQSGTLVVDCSSAWLAPSCGSSSSTSRWMKNPLWAADGVQPGLGGRRGGWRWTGSQRLSPPIPISDRPTLFHYYPRFPSCGMMCGVWRWEGSRACTAGLQHRGPSLRENQYLLLMGNNHTL